MFVEVTAPGFNTGFVRGQAEPDRDDDYLTDWEEAHLTDLGWCGANTDPYDRDGDDDGVLDGEEVLRRGLLSWIRGATDPAKVDSDGDGLADGLEAGLTTQTLFNERITTLTKTIHGWGDPADEHFISATARPAVGDTHAAAGLLLCDRDPASKTDPSMMDTDGDGCFDGPTIWVDAGNSIDLEELGMYAEDSGPQLRAGEDKNGDGKIDPAGVDGVLGTTDDEFDPTNPASVRIGSKIMAYDANRNRIPDAFEEFAAEVGAFMEEYYGQDEDEVVANIIADAQETYGNPNRSGGTSGMNAPAEGFGFAAAAQEGEGDPLSPEAAEAVSDENGIYAKIKENIRAEFEDIAIAAGEGLTPRAILGRQFTIHLLDMGFLKLLSDNELTNSDGTGGETALYDVDHNNSVDMYHGTFINGMCQGRTEVTSITVNLSAAYGIPVMYSLNATQGGGYDFVQSVAQTAFIALPYLLQLTGQPLGAQVANGVYHGYVCREKSVQSLIHEWERVWNLGDKDQHILHFAYSQGNIISRMALRAFRMNHPSGVDKRMHMVVMGSGYCWLTHRLLPSDTHFSYNTGDPVYKTVGGLRWNPLNYFNKDKWSVITGWPTDGLFDIEPHIHLEDIDRANCYSWWYYYVGGPIFQISRGNIDAERWWLNKKPPEAPWWDNSNVTVSAKIGYSDSLLLDGTGRLEDVKVLYEPWLWTNDDREFNAKKALRKELGRE